ncbi:MAG: VWA domain-containing protein, partial [Gammaproteobacteria bacterium]|nr:VWA domain-containing protein [Gammaproteobacteria bacterium]
MLRIGRGIVAVLAVFSISLVSAESPEVRVLIDVSGSMKKNDPANLRVPALRLLTELLPEDATAGVWMFAQDTAALIPTAEAGAGWKKQAAQAAERVHSRGLLTDIEAALSAATGDWQPAPQDQRRHIILLTDGVVDTSAEAEISAASRARILAKQIPRLQDLKASVHTIALSSEADHELLRALAEGTDGWYESVSTARDLQRTFLRMFEQAAPREGLPLDGNKFTVDSSIAELTVLAFSANPEDPVRLGLPDGSVNSLADHPENMRWRREAGYELITVSDPATGEWQLHAATDPDNRVLIVTDLKLQVSDIPTNMLHGETNEIVASFVDGGTPIERTDFLELAELTVNWGAAENDGAPGIARLALEIERSEYLG